MIQASNFLWTIKRISYKHPLSVKKLTANELSQETGGGTLVGRERILGNGERIKGDTRRKSGREPWRDRCKLAGK